LVDETGTNLAQSKGTNSSTTARDFWIPGNTRLLHNTNAIYLMDQDDKILNGVMLFGDVKWTERDGQAAQLMAGQEAWNGADPEDAVDADGNTVTRTICRAAGANSNSPADWYVTASSSATPGKVNSTKRYK
jgi:hypothetical protein